jgi:hypothetical protein
MTGQELELVEQMLPLLKDAYAAGGWLAVLPIVLPMLVQFYKSDMIQGFIPEKYQFGNLKLPAQFGVAFLVAAVPVFITKTMTSGPASGAVLAVTAGIAAAISYAKVLKPMGSSNTASRALAHTPQTVRNTVGLVARVDQAKINDWLKKIEEAKAAKVK